MFFELWTLLTNCVWVLTVFVIFTFYLIKKGVATIGHRMGHCCENNHIVGAMGYCGIQIMCYLCSGF